MDHNHNRKQPPLRVVRAATDSRPKDALERHDNPHTNDDGSTDDAPKLVLGAAVALCVILGLFAAWTHASNLVQCDLAELCRKGCTQFHGPGTPNAVQDQTCFCGKADDGWAWKSQEVTPFPARCTTSHFANFVSVQPHDALRNPLLLWKLVSP